MAIREYPNSMYCKKIGCGKIYVNIVRRSNGDFHFIQLFGKSDNDCGGSFRDALANILTFAIRRAKDESEIRAIIKGLVSQRCNKIVANEEHITSCADAIAKTLKEALLIDEPPKKEPEMKPLGEIGKTMEV